jgi:hypothetical protein
MKQLVMDTLVMEKPILPAGYFIYDPEKKLFSQGGSYAVCCHKSPKYYDTLGNLRTHVGQKVHAYRNKTHPIYKPGFYTSVVYSKAQIWENDSSKGGSKYIGSMRDFMIESAKKQRKKYSGLDTLFLVEGPWISDKIVETIDLTA